MTWFYYQLTIEDVLKTAPLINDARRRLSRQHLDSLVERVTKVMNRIEVWNIHRTFCEIVRHNDDYTVIESQIMKCSLLWEMSGSGTVIDPVQYTISCGKLVSRSEYGGITYVKDC